MSIELEPSSGDFEPEEDRRPRLPEPLPVRLIAVDDVRLPAPAGIEERLDALYVGILGFEKQPPEPATSDRTVADLVYRAENFLLRFAIEEGPVIVRDALRPQGIEVPSLFDAEHKLVDAEIDYTRERGLVAGQESLVLLDPAGNWIEIVEYREVR
jgi:hypothetical protein